MLVTMVTGTRWLQTLRFICMWREMFELSSELSEPDRDVFELSSKSSELSEPDREEFRVIVFEVLHAWQFNTTLRLKALLCC